MLAEVYSIRHRLHAIAGPVRANPRCRTIRAIESGALQASALQLRPVAGGGPVRDLEKS